MTVGNYRLDVSRTVTFDSSGGGTDYVKPNGARESWQISYISVSSTSVDSVPTIRFYRGSVIPSNFVTGTFSGTLDVDSIPNIELRTGEPLIGVWEGGDVGSTGTFHVEGNISLR